MKAPSPLRGRKTTSSPTKVKRGSFPQAQQLEATDSRQIIERLQVLLAEIDRLDLPVGQLGCEFLDALKIVERVSEKVFAKTRELLKREPTAIPNWHISETAQRVLSRDTQAVFRALSDRFEFDAEDFLQACSVSLGSLRKLISERNPGMSVDEIEFELNRTLENLIHHELIARLSRAKDRQIKLSLK